MNVPFGLLLMGLGSLLTYAGLMDPPKGVIGILGPLLRGEGLPGSTHQAATAERLNAYATLAQATAEGDLDAAQSAAAGGGHAGVVAYARKQLGKPYVWGGAGPKVFDCSGLTMQAAKAGIGITLPHNAEAQRVSRLLVPTKTPAPGDLVFFGIPSGHCGVVAGGGQMIVAPHKGDVVKVQKIARPGAISYRTYKVGAVAKK